MNSYLKYLIKKNLLTLLVIISGNAFAQVQIGQDIDGDSKGNNFGYSVSLSSNGNIIAIGAPRNNKSGYESGQVKVFKNHNNNWVQIAQNIYGKTERDFFGSNVSLSSDGNILAVSAKYHNGSGFRSGQVRVFKNLNNIWVQIGNDINGEAKEDNFGESINLSSNGKIIAIGAHGNNGNGKFSGHVRVFKYKNKIWKQIGQDIDGKAAGDGSGENVCLSSDGSIVAIASPSNDGNGDGSGHVRVFKNKKNQWLQVGQDIEGEASRDESGSSISLASNGNILAIGARGNDGNGGQSGHVRIFEYKNNTWEQIGQDIDGEKPGTFSGESISISKDGNVLAIGVKDNNGNGFRSGHVRIFKFRNNYWEQIGKDIDGEAELNYSGISVSLSSSGNIVAIGAHRNNGNGENSGHVRIYDVSEQ